ncbi:hypothetical protein BN2127_JRS10_00114 [Bacillus subtilis]|nr:hypothetical protein BN2127_JRS10_00114 [Bacillus subtilis]
MLESLFSEYVEITCLAKPFPVVAHKPINDRLFKHITFIEDESDITLRLTPVHIGQLKVNTLVQKQISLESSDEAVYRIKSVLSKEDNGVNESYWVSHKQSEYDNAISFNQYRAHGVSDKGLKSDWVYSDIKDEDGKEVIYNMIHDVIDLLLTANDSQIETYMEYITNDAFINIIREMHPSLFKTLNTRELKKVSMKEILHVIGSKSGHHIQEQFISQLGESFAMISNFLTTKFNEELMSSPEEFAQLLKIYKIFDQYQNTNKDFVEMVLQYFLVDSMEDLFEKTDIEVILQNEEETGIYLNGEYKLDIKGELIKAVSSLSLDDHFVSKVQDAVQLISEPIIFENIVAKKDESVARYLRMALRTVYAPLTAMDVRLMELDHELDDLHKSNSYSSLLEFTTIDDKDYEVRNLLVYDIVESLIRHDTDLQTLCETEILERIIKLCVDHRLNMWVDYSFEEIVTVLLGVGESFEHEYNKYIKSIEERKTVHSIDSYKIESTLISPLKEAFSSAYKEMLHIKSTSHPFIQKESQKVSLVESIHTHYETFKSEIKQHIQTNINEKITHQSDYFKRLIELWPITLKDMAIINHEMQDLYPNESVLMLLEDTANALDINKYFNYREAKQFSEEDTYYNLFKHYLRNPNRYRYLEKFDAEVQHNPRDVFIIDGSDVVQYALGEMENGWSLGLFKLGVNTLKGEVSES